MNKFTYALALGAGLVLSLAVPNAQADAIQDLTPTTMSATQFSSLYAAIPGTPALTESYSFLNTPQAGVVESQVFAGIAGTAAEGTYAYAYQFGVSSTATDKTGQPTSVNSASMYFNATPSLSNFTGPNASSYVITNGQVGSISLPQAGTGTMIQIPSSIAWNPGTTTGSLTFQYLNPTTNTGPLAAGAQSGTIVLISTQAPTTQPVSIQNPDPQTIYGYAYSPEAGSISGVPAPEPATILAWGSVLAALALGNRYRRNHTAV